MFDFSFSEVALIGVVALVVIGPERLPRVARTAGVLLNRAQRYAASVRADIEREVDLSEMRRVQVDLQGAANAFQADVRNSLAAAESEFEQQRKNVMQATQPALLPEPDAASSHSSADTTTLNPDSHLGARQPPVFEPAYPEEGAVAPAPAPAIVVPDSLMGWQRMLGPSAPARGPRSRLTA